MTPALGMLINWGSVADWVSGLGTVGTLVTGLVLISNERRDRLRDEASTLRAVLEVQDASDAHSYQPLILTITNVGVVQFNEVTIYRLAAIEYSDGLSSKVGVKATLSAAVRYSNYRHEFVDACRITTGQAGHLMSFMEFSFRGRRYVRRRGEGPQGSGTPWGQLRVKREIRKLLNGCDELVELPEGSFSYSRLTPDDIDKTW